MTDLSKCLIIHQGALGDLIITLTAVFRAKGDLRIDLFCRDALMAMVRHLKLAQQVYNVESPEFGRLFSGKTSSFLQSVFSVYHQIIVFSFSDELTMNIREMAPCPVLRVPPRPEPQFRVHVADFLVQRLAGIFSEKRPMPLFPSLPFNPLSTGPLLIHPGSGSLRKNRPLDDFIRIHRTLNEEGKTAIWVIGPAETVMVRELQKRSVPKDQIYLLEGLIDFISLVNRSSGFLGNDSGLTHLAAFLGHRVIAVFGPSDPFRWKPLGPGALAVRPDTGCIPCFEVKPANCPDPVCLKKPSADSLGSTLKTHCFV